MTPRRTIANQPDGVVARRPLVTRVTVSAVAIGLLVGTLVAFTAVRAVSSTGTEKCQRAEPQLRIVAVPEVATVIARMMQLQASGAGGCPPPLALTASDSASTAEAIRHEAIDRPDVWIPDSSAWTRRASAPGWTAGQ